jgi:hypothetical protein
LVVLGFEFRASQVLRRRSTTWAISPAQDSILMRLVTQGWNREFLDLPARYVRNVPGLALWLLLFLVSGASAILRGLREWALEDKQLGEEYALTPCLTKFCRHPSSHGPSDSSSALLSSITKDLFNKYNYFIFVCLLLLR